MPLDSVNLNSAMHLVDGWLEPACFPALAKGEVHVWLLNWRNAGNETSNLSLSGDELARAAKFKLNRDREQFVHCRKALRTLVGRYLDADPGEVTIDSGLNGKPYVSGDHQGLLHFNVSHSGDYALLAFSKDEIGVDIERHDARFIEPGTLDICMSPGERNIFEALDAGEQIQAFFETWTAKEAYLKLAGDGLTIEPSLIDLNCAAGGPTRAAIGGHEIFFNRTPNIPGYSAAIAGYNAPLAVRFHTFPAGSGLAV